MNLRDAIKKHKEGSNPDDFRAVIATIAEDLITKQLSGIEQEVQKEIDKLAGKIAQTEDEVKKEISKVINSDKVQRTIKDIITELIAKGMRGLKGDRGDKGDRGESIEGPQGPMGPRGKDYVLTSQDIRAIADIIPKPKDGLDGSPDSSNEVVDKVNSATRKIKLAMIDGLEERLKLLHRTISEKVVSKGGGGMGNVQHELFNVSSATTTVTTVSPISGNGYAIMGLFHNGQQLHRGTHYTVGGNRRTITLTFTPQDDTQITIVYIRG